MSEFWWGVIDFPPQDHYDPHCDYYRYVTDWIAPND